MMYNIAIVEDEKDLNHLIKTYLEKEGYKVTSFLTGNDAINNINDYYHLWILDIMLGDDISGYDIIKRIRDENEIVPVIFTSARDKDLDKIVLQLTYTKDGDTQVQYNFVAELLNKRGENRPNLLDKVFCNSRMLSADVDAALDPIYASVSERNNASFLGYGIGFNKYTGARGKSGASDANAEFVAEVRNMLEKNKIPYQLTELGKVDIGGGGTIAYILANKGVDVIDCGVPVLSMHAPYEVTSKFDIYCAYETYKAFWN